ncbi:MAG TPA: hypothetical protein VH575_12040 [Gemmataceae bacterium]|jgi:hypothetical protein
MDTAKRRYLLSSLFALFAVGTGAVLLLPIYAVARMPHMLLSGADYWRAIFRDILYSPAVIPMMFGLILVLSGSLLHVVSLARAFGLAKSEKSSGFVAGLEMVLLTMVIGGVLLFLLG